MNAKRLAPKSRLPQSFVSRRYVNLGAVLLGLERLEANLVSGSPTVLAGARRSCMKRALLGLFLVAGFVVAQNVTPSLDETLGLLENGITNAPLDAALTNIGNWQVVLEGSEDAALQDIGAQLGELATALQADTIDAQAVGGLLTSIGQGTITAGESAGDDQLSQLGGLLEEAGSSLTGGSSGMSGGEMSGGMMSGGASGGGM